jgi:AhpD family alkylhydroperoxidase
MNGTLLSPRAAGFSSVGASMLVALLPKCGACAMAHAALLGALGFSVLPTALPPMLAAASLAAALLLLAHGAAARRGYVPFWVGLAGAALLLAELAHGHAALPGGHTGHPMDTHAHGVLLTYAGAGMLLAASVWNAWPRRASAGVPAASAARCPAECGE